MNDLVSIIIPTYCNDETIESAIQSCLEQTYPNIEVLVIENGKKTGTEDLIEKFKDSRIHYFFEKEAGRSHARNIGLNYSRGKYVQFLDADDSLCLDKVAKSVDFLTQKPEYFGYCCGIEYRKQANTVRTIFPELNYKDELLAHNIFPIHSLIIRNQKGIFLDESLEYCEDWLFWVETCYNQKIYFDRTYIGGYISIHSSNTMKNMDRMNEAQLYVTQLIKKKYPERSRNVKINEWKLLMIHYFTQDKNSDTIKIVKENSFFTYSLVKVICSLPIIGSKLHKKIQLIENKNMYQ